MKKQNKIISVKETLLSEIEEVKERLEILKKRISNSEKIGVGDGILKCTGKIIELVAQYQILMEKYDE